MGYGLRAARKGMGERVMKEHGSREIGLSY